MVRPRRTEVPREAVSTLLRVGPGASGHRSNSANDPMRTVQVRAAMKEVPVGIASTATLEEAEERMDSAGVNWLPVVDRGHLVGLLTRLDIRQALSNRVPTRSA